MIPDASGLRVLVLAPVGRDGPAMAEVLGKQGIQAEICASLADLIKAMETEAGTVLLAEEALFNKPHSNSPR